MGVRITCEQCGGDIEPNRYSTEDLVCRECYDKVTDERDALERELRNKDKEISSLEDRIGQLESDLDYYKGVVESTPEARDKVTVDEI